MVAPSASSRFGITDYVLFVLSLAISACIGIYYACTGGKQRSTKEFLMADRNMPIFPVTMSLVASFLSAIAILGLPVEAYTYGTMYTTTIFSLVIYIPITAHVFLPIYHNLQLVSAYEYLELRFNRLVRLLGSFTFVLVMTMYMAVVLYAPALALSQVTGIPLAVSITSVGVVCTFYTAIGGMKAVLWTDVIQMFIIYGGVLTVIIRGVMQVGGFHVMWDRAVQGGRIQIVDFDPSPLTRMSTLSTFVMAGLGYNLAIYATWQTSIQRLLCITKLRNAQKAVYLNMPIIAVNQVLFALCGLVIYALYYDCDPLSAGYIDKPDQLVPEYVVEELGDLPGIAGVFVAAAFSGALSTVSSALNSMAAVVLEDFIKPALVSRNKEMSDEKYAKMSKFVALTFGILTIALSFIVEYLGSTVIQMTLSIFGTVGGPLLGLFSLGVLFPMANTMGALCGFLCSMAISMWIGFGTIVAGPSFPVLPTSTEGCRTMGNNSFTSSTTLQPTSEYNTPSNGLSTASSPTGEDDILFVYKISFLWYGVISVLVSWMVGLPVSYISDCYRKTKHMDIEPVDERLTWPICHKIQALFRSVSQFLARFRRPKRQTRTDAGNLDPLSSKVALTELSGEYTEGTSGNTPAPLQEQPDVVSYQRSASAETANTEQAEQKIEVTLHKIC